ncbi:MAG: hypothetical protein HFI72_04155 [Peptococcaceae bacterium]|jgi:hypothetical protein|nr:hypothetical protein [Peptococcaceae bacterium]
MMMDENKEVQTPEELQTEPEVTVEVPAVDEVPVEEAAVEKAVVEGEATEAVVEPEEAAEATEELVVASGQDIVVEKTPAPALEETQPPKKKKTGLIIGIVAAAIVVGGAAFAMLGGDSGPKKIVKEAIANSYAQSEALVAQMQEEIPFMKKAAELQDKNTHTDFNITLNSLNGIEGAEAFNLLFSGANIQGSVEMTPDMDTMSLNGALNVMGREFISATLYQSPDAIAFGLPSISQKIVGIDLNTYKKDIENSPLKDAGLEVDEMINSIDEMKASLKSSAVSNDAMDAMTKKIQKMTEDLMDKATYTQGETVGDVTEYTVTIAPKDVKNYVVSLMSYIMLDSPLRAIYETEYNTAMMYEGGDYESDMKEVLAAMKEHMPDLAVEIVYDINEDTEIVRMEMNVTTPNASADDAVKLEKFTLTSDGDGTSGNIYGEFSMSIEGETLDIIMTCDASYLDKVYAINAVMGMMVDDEQMDMSFDYEIDGNTDKDNIYFDMTMGIDQMDILDMYCIGDAYVDGEALVYNLERLGMLIDDGEESMGFDFSLGLKQHAIDQVEEVSYTNIFTMSEMELMNWMMEYNNGFNQLVGGFGALE